MNDDYPHDAPPAASLSQKENKTPSENALDMYIRIQDAEKTESYISVPKSSNDQCSSP
jgi:hypothetical protein